MPPKRSNKTARVLNLIAGAGPETEPEKQEAPVTPDPAPVPVEAEETEAPKPQEEKPARKTSSRTRSTSSKKAQKQPEPATPTAEPSPSEEAPVETPTEEPAPASTTLPPAPQPIVPIVQTVREKEQALADDIRAGLLQALTEAEGMDDLLSLDTQPLDSPEPAPQPPEVSMIPEQPPVQEEVPEPSEAPASESKLPPAATPDDVLAQTIASELSIEEEPQPISEMTSTVEPTPEPESEIQQMPLSQAEPAPAPPAPAEADISYCNVLQALVEENAAYYTKHMLQCACPRCVADMKALALTNLPSKYVVLSETEKNAHMSVFSARYANEVAIQMVRACMIVNDHPHHSAALTDNK